MARSSPPRSRHRHHPLPQQQQHHRHRHRRHSSRDRSPPYPSAPSLSNHKAPKAPETSSISQSDPNFRHRDRYHRHVYDGRRRAPHPHKSSYPRRDPTTTSNSSSSTSSCSKSAEAIPAGGVMNRSPKRHDSGAPRSGTSLLPSDPSPPTAVAQEKVIEARGEGARSRSDPPQRLQAEVAEQVPQSGQCTDRSSRKRAVWELACALAHAYVSQLDSSRRSEEEETEEASHVRDGKDAQGPSKRSSVREEPDPSTSASSSSTASKRMDTALAAKEEPCRPERMGMAKGTDPCSAKSVGAAAVASETESSRRTRVDVTAIAAETESSRPERVDTAVIAAETLSSRPMRLGTATVAAETVPYPPTFMDLASVGAVTEQPTLSRPEEQTLKEPIQTTVHPSPGAIREAVARNGPYTDRWHQKTKGSHQKGEEYAVLSHHKEKQRQEAPPTTTEPPETWRRSDFRGSNHTAGARKRQMVFDLNAMPMDEDDDDGGNENISEELLDLNAAPVKMGIDLNMEPFGASGWCVMEVDEDGKAEAGGGGRGKMGAKQQAPAPSGQRAVKEWLGKHLPSSAAAAMVS